MRRRSWGRAAGPWLGLVVVGAAAAQMSCSVGSGSGTVASNRLQAPGCFDGPYDLRPTFFAANPFRNTQTIRVQRRDDIVENSDGIEVLVGDTARVRASLGAPLKVGMPPGVTPPGVAIRPDPDPPIVQFTLYLHDTCHGQNISLYATGGTIIFQKLFSGNANEENADDKLTEAAFDVFVGDPRDEPPEGGPIPQGKLSRVTGDFRFFFERGQPAQPFP